jgi:replication factor C subunit 2/4
MTAANPVPFVEKYRPKNLDEIVDQDDSVSSLKRSMKSMNLPHLLFYG